MIERTAVLFLKIRDINISNGLNTCNSLESNEYDILCLFFNMKTGLRMFKYHSVAYYWRLAYPGPVAII